EAAAAVFSWIGIRCGADEGTRWCAIEIEKVHNDYVIDDARQLAPGAGAFELQALFLSVEVVDDSFKDAKQHDVGGARLLRPSRGRAGRKLRVDPSCRRRWLPPAVGSTRRSTAGRRL